MSSQSVFLNQAGTSWPKPAPVRDAVATSLTLDPGGWESAFSEQHDGVARAFGVRSEEMLLTPGGTSALAAAVSVIPWAPGDSVVTSAMEHEALAVPLRALADRGIARVVIPRAGSGPIDLPMLERRLRGGDVRLVAVTAVSNVTGERLPIEDIVDMAHEYGSLCLIDASQWVGWERLDLRALDADAVAFAGHKALHGVWGVGGLYLGPSLPSIGWCDVGSVDRSALAGLVAALDWLEHPGQRDRLSRCNGYADQLVTFLRAHESVTLHGRCSDQWRLPVVAFTSSSATPDLIASRLRAQGVWVSGGHQCAPEAHRALGTDPEGVVRCSFGAGNTEADIRALLDALGPLL